MRTSIEVRYVGRFEFLDMGTAFGQRLITEMHASGIRPSSASMALRAEYAARLEGWWVVDHEVQRLHGPFREHSDAWWYADDDELLAIGARA